ncbi:hypothetical protein [Brevibacillus parabrevis]|jgi:hypothetical protein|uniref:Uncharacterized protein n=1 Tax=Brevibacillus parabrevis TaxID=54914 RepID=A0A4Y3PB88_BREPA|nr:hypothetical protein [Brevibacillus parabrevis]MED2253310.1 hypothetical protein [Brevibacillus parabrevis]WDV97052.1 hypothetical protein PSE45_08865 [Brevibacillus parabrevis]GEB31692.1 hypothetical protein BPA01_12720 [Brevibacillus parabrevis]
MKATNGYDLFGSIPRGSYLRQAERNGPEQHSSIWLRPHGTAKSVNVPAESTSSYKLNDLLNRLTEYKDDKGTTTYKRIGCY